MNELQLFKNEEFGTIRTVEINGDGWFVAADVCRILEIGNPSQALTRLDADEKNTLIINEGNRGNPNVNVINESGLYALVLNSRKPNAKKFRKWITNEVVPAIRKHGVYATDDFIEKTLANPDFAIKVLTQLKEERERNAILQPKADYCDAVLDSDEVLDLSAIAQEYGLSGQTLNRMLSDFMIQYRKGGTWYLYQKYVGKGYARLKTVYVNGRTITYLAWTQKGRYFLYQELKKRGILPVDERQHLLKGA